MPLAVPERQDPQNPTLQAHNDPLTLEDVSNTVIHIHETLQNVLHHPLRDAAHEDLALSSKHLAVVVSTHNAQELEAPPWFQAGLDAALRTIKDDIKDIKTEVATMKTNIATLTTDVNEMNRRTAIEHNRGCGEGVAIPYWVVKTADGEYPHEMDPPLPRLLKRQDILSLTVAQLNAYLDAYNLSKAGTVAVRKQVLAEYIGCPKLLR